METPITVIVRSKTGFEFEHQFDNVRHIPTILHLKVLIIEEIKKRIIEKKLVKPDNVNLIPDKLVLIYGGRKRDNNCLLSECGFSGNFPNLVLMQVIPEEIRHDSSSYEEHHMPVGYEQLDDEEAEEEGTYEPVSDVIPEPEAISGIHSPEQAIPVSIMEHRVVQREDGNHEEIFRIRPSDPEAGQEMFEVAVSGKQSEELRRFIQRLTGAIRSNVDEMMNSRMTFDERDAVTRIMEITNGRFTEGEVLEAYRLNNHNLEVTIDSLL